METPEGNEVEMTSMEVSEEEPEVNETESIRKVITQPRLLCLA